MWVRLTLDNKFVIRAIESSSKRIRGANARTRSPKSARICREKQCILRPIAMHKGQGAMNDNLIKQQMGVMRFATQMTAAQLQVLVHRFWTDELEKPRYAESEATHSHGFKVYSQNDEDGIIQEIFRRIGTQDRTFIEFGVANGYECNTAKLLLEGWRGLWIEGHPGLGGVRSGCTLGSLLRRQRRPSSWSKPW